ncbi:MAG TPA: 30S ribosome-binding factor RbfA [Candidatus Deferrimicrobiaceae bacterium]
MKGRGDRHVRVAERIREEISLILQNRVKDPGAGSITVTDVTVTPDLRMARVFYSVLGDEEMRKAARDALRRSKGYIRRELGQVLRIRYSPELTFLYDATFEKGVRIERLLRETGSREGNGGE